jgi:hypothetical protein
VRGCAACAPFAVIASPGPWAWDVTWAIARRRIRGHLAEGQVPSVRVLCLSHWQRETN